MNLFYDSEKEDYTGYNRYLVTIRAGALRYISREEIDEVFNNMVSKLKGYEWSQAKGYELDKDGRWHFHTYCHGPRVPYLKGFSKNSLYVHFQENAHSQVDKVIRYVLKEDQSQFALDEKDWESQAKYNYLFQD